MSNLFKAGFVSFDQSDARIIDNNDLSNRKIEAYQERELKRQRTRMMQEEGYEEGDSVEDFVPGSLRIRICWDLFLTLSLIWKPCRPR